MEGSVSDHLEAAAEVAKEEEVVAAVEDVVEDVEDKVDELPTKSELETMMHECIREETPAIAAAVAAIMLPEIEDAIEDVVDEVEDIVEDVTDKVEDVVEDVIEETEDVVEDIIPDEDDLTTEVPAPDSPPERTHWLHKRIGK